jgi:hypothetical protein
VGEKKVILDGYKSMAYCDRQTDEKDSAGLQLPDGKWYLRFGNQPEVRQEGSTGLKLTNDKIKRTKL